MKIYSIDVLVYATAYIRAANVSEAMEKARKMRGASIDTEQGGDVVISGANYDDPALPDVSLSPAMTVCGPDADATVSEAGQ